MGLQILVVDDNQSITALLEDIIDLEDHTATVVHNGNDAINALSGNSFDLAFCDLTLPDISGWEVVEYIKEKSPNVEIAVISGLGDNIPQDKLSEHNISLVIKKPFQITEIQSLLQEVAQ